MPTSPSTWRPGLRALLLVPLVLIWTMVSSCGDRAHTSAPTSAGQAIGGVLERRAGPASHLLAADRMPTAGTAWSDIETSGADFTVQGPCHLTSLGDLGAVKAVRRSWSTPESSPSAVQVVGRFADGRSAWRAHQVLASWRERCSDLVDGEVGPMHSFSVSTGLGQTYRVTQGDVATDVGILRKGSYLSVATLLTDARSVRDGSALAKSAVRRIAQTY